MFEISSCLVLGGRSGLVGKLRLPLLCLSGVGLILVLGLLLRMGVTGEVQIGQIFRWLLIIILEEEVKRFCFVLRRAAVNPTS